jgi:peptide/nickel transport system ATP-binding protein/oligopeptide transport system ATP-binding protein
MGASDLLLDVQGLRTSFFTNEGEVRAVDGVDFQVFRGKTLGIVGESGCGKSVTSLSIMRLVAAPAGKIVGGKILYQGRDLVQISAEEMRKIRGNQISMVFQEPMTSLNPVFTVGNQIGEAIALHQDLSRSAVRDRTIEMLKLVGIPSPERRVDDYPHQLSGGMRQRVMIAMALSCDPQLLIADEPTTALDVTIQAQILELLRELQQKVGLGLILITHDLGVVAEMADDVMVMYAGKAVEYAKVSELFREPRMPYTKGLLNSIPSLGKQRLEAIPGIVPSLLHLPKGCAFQERCAYVFDRCRQEAPQLRVAAPSGRLVRCHKDIQNG